MKKNKIDIISKLIVKFLEAIWTAGNIAMLVCGSLDLSNHTDFGINDGGCIAMIVISVIFGILPLLKNVFRGRE